MNRMAHQLCLPLTEVTIPCAGRAVRAIPEIVRELFELSDNSPSGLVWRADTRNGRKKAGEMAGSRLNNRSSYYQVSVTGHGLFYTHRIAYYLKTGTNPGSMVIRHIGDNELVLGWQEDNGRDEKSRKKKADAGYTTRVMYRYKGKTFNLSKLCAAFDLPYSKIYQRIKRCGHSPEQALAEFGFDGIEVVHNH